MKSAVVTPGKKVSPSLDRTPFLWCVMLPWYPVANMKIEEWQKGSEGLGLQLSC